MAMEKQPTVSIGIPAYNEGENIKALLLTLLSQQSPNFELLEITVASDNSSDNTVTEVKSIGDSRIKVIEGTDRKGKMARFNELADAFGGDLFLQFDADVKIEDPLLISKLVSAYSQDPTLGLICGDHAPLKPNTYVERLAHFGAVTWANAVTMLGDKGDRYHCFGHIRMFSRNFLLKFRYPTDLTLSEDVYSYYYAKANGYKTKFVSDAIVYFRLPTTVGDYVKQITRFISSDDKLRDAFGAELVTELNTMTDAIRLKALKQQIFRTRPDIFISYILLQLYTRHAAKTAHTNKAIWDIAKSTKKL